MKEFIKGTYLLMMAKSNSYYPPSIEFMFYYLNDDVRTEYIFDPEFEYVVFPKNIVNKWR